MKDIFDTILNDSHTHEGNIISILQEIQAHFGYISEDSVSWFSQELDIPESRIFGIITFYPQFHLKPRGENIISICHGTACHLKGSDSLTHRLRIELGIAPHEDTTDDQKFTVEKAGCIGACNSSPAVIIRDKVHGKMTIDKLLKEINTLKKHG
jgi:NADH:ubiquinone oxidoreductase subunit E